jgi:serine/threonine protein kinase
VKDAAKFGLPDAMTSGAATSSNVASSTHDELCRQIYEQIYRKLERADEDILRFATRGTARKVLQRDNFLPLFLSSLVLPESTAMDQFGLTEEIFCDRIDKRKLHDFLAILIFASCGIEAARAFTTKLVATKAWPVIDRKRNHISSLPASRIDLIELFSDVVAADKFFMTQALFCTVQIRKREEVRIQNPDGQRLPYLAEQPLAKGSFGKVFKVKIAKGHFYDPKTGLANPDPIEIARKDYLISKEFRVQGEREIMEKILTSTARTCENILENYGSLEIGPGTYCLFMPLAICDLSVYMLQHHTMRPITTAEKAKIILSAQGLAGGLNFLHREMKTSEMEDLVCYHMDLKPNNILLFRETINNEDRIIWKISDFGMARVKIRRRGQDGEREKDFNSWFLKRQKPPDPSPSHTWNQRGEGTYLAPESIASTRSMKAESDVWSLACVISVVFAYLDDGGKGVSDYLEERINYASSAGLDRFFLRGTRFTPTKVHPVVKKWHERLIDRASGRDINEGSAVKFMLDYLEDRVFQIEPTKRHSAKEVQERLQRTFKMYQDMGRTDENPPRRGAQPPKRFMRRVRQAR